LADYGGDDHAYSLKERDRVWRAFDFGQSSPAIDAEVQAIIDAFNPLEYEKAEVKKRLIEQCNSILEAFESQYPESEKRTFDRQESEARAYVADNSTVTPVLSVIASARGLTVSEVANKVITKADYLLAQVSGIIATRQTKEDQAEAETDWTQLKNINMS
jgi:hypothetical protein